MERVLELTFPCNQIGEYLTINHKAFIQELMEADAENQAQGRAPEIQSRKEGENI